MRPLTDSEVATILCALRAYQFGLTAGDEPTCVPGDCDHFADADPLDGDGIAALCEAINFDGVFLETA